MNVQFGYGMLSYIYQLAIEKIFLKSVKTFPVVILTGARQTGKSTLCKTLLHKTHRYVSLEDPDIRRQALEDPRTFLQNYPLFWELCQSNF